MVKEDSDKEDAKEVSERPKVYVMGLSQDISESEVSTFFSNYGKVTEVVFKTAADGKILRGLAYIYFESQESVDKLLEEKTVTIEDRKVHVKRGFEEIGKEGEKPELDIAPEALKCIVCKKDKFFSVASYLNHRKGRHHQAVLKIYRSKSASVRQLLKAEATLAVDRNYSKAWMKKYPEFNHFCDICKCQIYCNPEQHKLSTEHKLLKNYDVQKCCDIEFTERKKYENHLLSLSHLKYTYEKEQMNKTGDDEPNRLTMKKAIDVFKQCDADLKELKETYGELDLNEELPPFDPEMPLGLNFIVKKINFHCLCCDQKFFPNKNLVEPHCRSYLHFCNMQDYILKLEKEQGEKKRKERENEKEEQTEDTKNEGQTGKRKNEEAYKPNKKVAKETGDKESITSKVAKETGDKESITSKVAKSESTKMDENADEESETEQQGAEDVEEMDILEKTVSKTDFNEDEGDDEEEDVHGNEDEDVQDKDVQDEDVQDEDVQDEEENVQDKDIQEVVEDEEEPIEDKKTDEPVADQESKDPNEDQDDDEILEIPVVKEKKLEVVDIHDDVSVIEDPAEDVAKEEAAPVEVEVPKRPQTATRGRRGRGRFKGLKR